MIKTKPTATQIAKRSLLEDDGQVALPARGPGCTGVRPAARQSLGGHCVWTPNARVRQERGGMQPRHCETEQRVNVDGPQWP
jgi:hypothetical protein